MPLIRSELQDVIFRHGDSYDDQQSTSIPIAEQVCKQSEIINVGIKSDKLLNSTVTGILQNPIF